MFGHSCSFKTVLLSLLQVVVGRRQPAPKAWQMLGLAVLRWVVVGQVEVPVGEHSQPIV